MSDCLFCRIASKDLESDMVHESDGVVAFRDINPTAPTHILLIPKRHIASVKELAAGDGDLLAEIFDVANQLAASENLDRGYRIVTNVGPAAGQSVHHLHFHLIGGRDMSWPPG